MTNPTEVIIIYNAETLNKYCKMANPSEAIFINNVFYTVAQYMGE